LQPPIQLQNTKTHAEAFCNQLPIATATATKPKIHLEKAAIKVGHSKPRQLLPKQKQNSSLCPKQTRRKSQLYFFPI
jgi:hypothetical protein